MGEGDTISEKESVPHPGCRSDTGDGQRTPRGRKRRRKDRVRRVRGILEG